MSEAKKINIVLFWIALVHISGAVGMAFVPDFFLPLTALNLLSTAGLLLWVEKGIHWKSFVFIGILGWCIEWLGVHTGKLFGVYHYGANLGWRLDDIPLVIGINWALLVIGFYQVFIALWPQQSIIIRAIGVSLSMVALDALIESVAPAMDFWTFNAHYPPLQNFIAWGVITFLFVVVLHFFNWWRSSLSPRVWLVFLAIQFVFFLLANFLLA